MSLILHLKTNLLLQISLRNSFFTSKCCYHFFNLNRIMQNDESWCVLTETIFIFIFFLIGNESGARESLYGIYNVKRT